jgi:Abortive infection alpha
VVTSNGSEAQPGPAQPEQARPEAAAAAEETSPAPSQAPSQELVLLEPAARLEVAEVPGLLRLTLTTAWRAVAWTTGTVLQTSTGMIDRVLDGDPPVTIVRDTLEEVRGALIAMLGGDDTGYGARPSPAHRQARASNGGATLAELRARGAALLEQSADVDAAAEDAGHPAYARMLSEITPDEARILRLLYTAGPQPALDVRTFRPLGIGSELVSGGLNMIGENAGLRRMDQINPYLTNLNRQGLIDFSKEQVEDPGRYQLIEAQPSVAEARRRAGHASKIVYRSISLTTFGRDFCRDILPSPNGSHAELDPPQDGAPVA